MSKQLSDYVGILAHSALASPVKNKLKGPTTPAEYYALVAFPPEAGEALYALLTEAATAAFGGLHPDVRHSVKPNSALAKPIVGIPGDWLVVRGASQFAPYVADASGVQLEQQDPTTQARIRSEFYPGRKVRALFPPYSWTNQASGRGISFNISGVMLAGDGERLSIGNSAPASVFQRHAGASAPVASANPFSAPTQPSVPVTSAAAPCALTTNPFLQKS